MLEPDGGFHNHTGVSFEEQVTLRFALDLLDDGGEVAAVRWQPRPREGARPDVLVTLRGGGTRHVNCKKNRSGSAHWTMKALTSEGVLAEAAEVLSTDAAAEFWFASELAATDLGRLAVEASTHEGDEASFRAILPEAVRAGLDTWLEAVERLPEAERVASLRRVRVWHFPAGMLNEACKTHGRFLLEDAEAGLPVIRVGLRDSPREEVTAETVRGWLGAAGLRVRGHLDHAAAREALAQRRKRFRDELRPWLIGGGVLSVPLVDQVVEELRTDAAAECLRWVVGGQGAGKSVVALDLMERLDADGGFEVLPIRLDSAAPGVDLAAYGRDTLGLPDSPAATLRAAAAAGRRPVLLLDQIDAIRWTQRHQGTATAALAGLIDETLQLLDGRRPAVVAVCRAFDLEEDPGLRGLHAERRGVTHEVPPLSDEVAAASLGLDKAGWDALPPRARSLLSLPQGLYLWHEVNRPGAPGRGGGDPAVAESLPQLTQEFLHAKGEAWERAGGEVGALMGHARAVAAAMDRWGEVSVPRTALDAPRREVDRLVSIGLLREAHGGRLAFGHQTVGEFVSAEVDLAAMEAGGLDLASFLKETPPGVLQGERLRRLLWLRRARRRRGFAGEVEAVMAEPAVRFHLRHTLTGFLGGLADPTEAEAAALLRCCDADASTADLIRGRVFHRSEAWTKVAVGAGLLDPLLDGEDADARGFAIGWLCRAPDARPAPASLVVIERLIAEWAEQPEKLKQLAEWTRWFAWDVGSEALFEMRAKHHAEEDASHRYTEWDKAAKQHPSRAVRLAETNLRHLERRIRAGDLTGRMHVESEEWERGLDGLLAAVAADPQTAWKVLYPRLVSLIESVDTPAGEDGPDRYRTLGRDHNGAKVGRVLERLLEAVVGAAAAVMPERVRGLLADGPIGTHAWRSQRAVALGLAGLPAEHAAAGLAWLLEEDIRFWCPGPTESQPRFATPAEAAHRFLEAHSEDLSAAELDGYIQRVMALPQEGERRRHIEDYDPQWKWPRRPEIGRQRHALLSAVPADRLSIELRGQLGVWMRKFGEVPRGESSSHTGWGSIASPISQGAARKLSDEAWLALIRPLVRLQDGGRRNRWRQRENGGTTLSGPVELGRTMEAQAFLEPTRFVRLAARFPPGTPHEFLEAVLRAACLNECGDAKRFGREIPEGVEWTPAPVEEVDALLARLTPAEREESARVICRVVSGRPGVRWSAAVLDALAWIACHHPDPEGDPPPESEDDRYSRTDAKNRSINDARAVAAAAVAVVVHGTAATDPARVAMRPTLDRLTRDPAVSVRVAATRVALLLLKEDEEAALGFYFRLVEGVADEFWGTHDAALFLKHTYLKARDRFDRLLLDLLAADGPEGETFAAKWIGGVWLHDGGLEEAAARLRSPAEAPSPAVRAAFAGSLATHPWDGSDHGPRVSALREMLADPDPGVRNAAGDVLLADDFWRNGGTHAPLLVAGWMATSSEHGFTEHAEHQLWAVAEHVSMCRGFVPELLKFCRAACEEAASIPEPGERPTINPYFGGKSLAKLVLIACAEAEEAGNAAGREACMDAWDQLLRCRLLDDGRLHELLDEVQR